MRYTVRHSTEFSYTLPVISAQHVLQLKPRALPGRQSLFAHNIDLSLGAEMSELADYFGNALYEVRLPLRHESLHIESMSELDVRPRDDILLDLSPAWEQVRDTLSVPLTGEQWEAAQFCFPSPRIDPHAAEALAAAVCEPGMPLLRLADALTRHIHAQFTYQGGVTDVHTPVGEVLRSGMGVCQDFAHIGIAALRHLGLAARYVSGYILSHLDNRPALVGAEASHAWLSVYCPEFGWVDFDPTNNQLTSDQHIVLAWGRDYADVAPTRGSLLGGGTQQLTVDVQVRVQA